MKKIKKMGVKELLKRGVLEDFFLIDGIICAKDFSK